MNANLNFSTTNEKRNKNETKIIESIPMLLLTGKYGSWAFKTFKHFEIITFFNGVQLLEWITILLFHLQTNSDFVTPKAIDINKWNSFILSKSLIVIILDSCCYTTITSTTKKIIQNNLYLFLIRFPFLLFFADTMLWVSRTQ